MVSLLCIGASCTFVAACDRGKTDAAPSASASATTASASASAAVAEPQRRKKRKPPPLVYVDGEVVGVLKYGELPVGFEATIVQRGQPFSIFNLARYLERLGVKLDDVKGVHLVGASRTAAITGDEIRRVKDQLHFKFAREFSGAPMVDWPDGRVEATTRIDRITELYVFVAKEAPSFDRPTKSFRWADGSEVQGVPHAKGAPITGARVYLDGRLLGSLDALRGQSGDGRRGEGRGAGRDSQKASHALAGFLKNLGAPLDALKAIDFVSRDDLTVGRLDAQAWAETREALRFELAQQGQAMRMHMPAPATPAPGLVDVSAVLLYSQSEPPARDVKAPKQRPGEGRGEGPGMGADDASNGD